MFGKATVDFLAWEKGLRRKNATKKKKGKDLLMKESSKSISRKTRGKKKRASETDLWKTGSTHNKKKKRSLRHGKKGATTRKATSVEESATIKERGRDQPTSQIEITCFGKRFLTPASVIGEIDEGE